MQTHKNVNKKENCFFENLNSLEKLDENELLLKYY